MIKALIVDDEKHVRIAIEKLAKWTEHNIEAPSMASNGKEALEIMSSLQPDIVFMDIRMPVMNGLDFLKEAKVLYPLTQFIIVSGYDDFSYAQEALRSGATDYLLKPVEGEMLNNAIEHALKKLSDLSSDPVDSSAADAQEATLSPEQVIVAIKSYVDKNYSENIRMSMFAEQYFFSKEYLSKQFKAKYGYNIYEYVLKVRMEMAKELLSDDAIKIQDVGAKVGFADNNYFSKAFKNYYGISPSEFRKQ